MDKQDIQQWSGEGLPPVGTVCKGKVYGSDKWIDCLVLHRFVTNCAVQENKSGELYYCDEFLTPEQIESGRRERIVDRLYEVFISNAPTRADSGLYAIYDAIRAGKIEGVKIDG